MWSAANMLQFPLMNHEHGPIVYAVVSDIQDLWKFWVDFCKCIFYTYIGHNLCKKCGWHFFGSHLGYLAAILNWIILWTLFSINPLLWSNLLLLTSLYLMYFILLHHTNVNCLKLHVLEFLKSWKNQNGRQNNSLYIPY